FGEVHCGNLIRAVESHTLLAAAAQQLPTPPLRHLVRRAWDEQQRFPLKVVTVLSQQFASHGLQFFKVNRTVTHVAIARPHYLDLDAAPVSEGVKRIVLLINATPKCTRRQLIEIIAPAPARPAVPTPAPAAEGAPVITEAAAAPSQEPGPESAAVAAPQEPAVPPAPEASAQS